MLSPADVTMTPAAQKLHAAEDVVAPGQQAPIDLTVFISCYNEQEFIVKTIETVRDALNEIGTVSYETIVVDDGSNDGSIQKAAARGFRTLATSGRMGPAVARNTASMVSFGSASSPQISR